MKQRVHYTLLEDMKKYIKGTNLDDYESSCYPSDPSVVEYVREYYDKHLPVDVAAWCRVNIPDSKLIYGKCLGEQVSFVCETLCSLLRPNYEEWKNNPPLVISTYHSKSVRLPVYHIDLKEYGVEIILRYNFYDWKVSVKSNIPLDFDCTGLFNPLQTIPSIYCDGFPQDKVYGSYKRNHSQFTIEILSKYEMYTFIFLLKNYLGIKKDY